MPEGERAGGAEVACWEVRIDRLEVQRLGAVHVADAGDHALIKQGLADRDPPARQGRDEGGGVAVGTERIRPEPRKERALSAGIHELAGRRTGEIDGEARADDPQAHLATRLWWRDPAIAESSEEAEVDVQRAYLAIRGAPAVEQVLSPGVDVDDLAAVKRARRLGRPALRRTHLEWPTTQAASMLDGETMDRVAFRHRRGSEWACSADHAACTGVARGRSAASRSAARGSVRRVTAPAPSLSVPLVWAELITSDVLAAVDFYGAVLQWKSIGQPGSTDLTVYLDQARIAGPICGIRPRTPADPRPLDVSGPAPDRWSVRLSPPRPSLAADPGGDQLLRPRSPGPRIGRWSVPRSLCFAELRTPDVAGAQRWMERRLDAVFRHAEDPAGGPAVLQLESSFDPQTIVASIVDEQDPSRAGWALAVQVPDLDLIGATVVERGGRIEDRPVPLGFPAETAATIHDPGGARMILIEHGPLHGRRG